MTNQMPFFGTKHGPEFEFGQKEVGDGRVLWIGKDCRHIQIQMRTKAAISNFPFVETLQSSSHF